MKNGIELLIGSDARTKLSFKNVYRGYNALMREFHGDDFFIEQEQFSALLRSRTELLIFAVDGEEVVGTAQATLVQTPPMFQVYVSNVVVAKSCHRSGIGAGIMNYLQMRAKSAWGKVGRLRVFLTNAPQKRNGQFYRKLDFTPRIDDQVTVVWEKII